MKKKLRLKVYNKYDGHCAYCGERIEYNAMQVDHIIPQYNFVQQVTNKIWIPDFLLHLTVDDIDHIDNLNPACRVCNKWKNTHHLDLFRSELYEQLDRLNKRSSNYRIAKKYGQIKETPHKVEFYFEKENARIKHNIDTYGEILGNDHTISKIYKKFEGKTLQDIGRNE